MDLVRNPFRPAWITLGQAISPAQRCFMKRLPRTARRPLEDSMLDLAYIGLTILVFAVLFLIIKGVERFER